MASAATNFQYISRGFQILLQAYAPYVATNLINEYGPRWWQLGVLGVLKEEQKRNLPTHGSDDTLMKSLDISLCLTLLHLHWGNIFRKRLPIDFRTWSKELMGVRNRWAHAGTEAFNDNDTWRALDTMSRLCEHLNLDDAEAIRSLLRESRYGSAEGSMASSSTSAAQSEAQAVKVRRTDGIISTNAANLPCWRDVMTPHPDVAQGKYRKAEFAADLAQVARGEGAWEYRDPVEFFARTYVTQGMKDLLVQAVRRVCGFDGEPVIQLKTAFGGGKTHSMLALYHLLRGKVAMEKIPAVKPVLDAAGVSSLPPVHTAVLVGTSLDPSHSKRPQNMPGITINTLWGEMAAQLALSAGNLALYDYVKEADKKGVSPGSETLMRLFDACGSCLVLVDELVAYAKKIYGVQGLPAGSFDNFISFIQELTEAARASQNSLVVASLPESENEIGGEAGRIALDAIEHTFGRMEAIWKPVAASEGFEIVRRRLFLDCPTNKEQERETVCEHFSQLYREHPGDFPVETRELDYKQRLIACYPIHPEIFDRLYEDWATLENFQRTRGVLRLMAAVIHELWMSEDKSLLIMPGSLPMDIANVRDELTRYLPEEWNGLVDREVDGRKSIPYQLDKENERYGRSLAARRVARTIMLGSAPSVRQQNVRGIEITRIRLGVVQPAEQIAVFNDALNSLQNKLTYLYTSSSYDRFWFDTRPTLRKTVADRASQLAQERAKVAHEIETRLKKVHVQQPFSGIHICPASSLDVPDEQSVRMVVLSSAQSYTPSAQDCAAMQACREILETRGSSPRKWRNMLIFLAADQAELTLLEQQVCQYLAWKSIEDQREELNLDQSQLREAAKSREFCNQQVNALLSNTWSWLLIPGTDDGKTIRWDSRHLSGNSPTLTLNEACRSLQEEEDIVTKYASQTLLMELDKLLWKDRDHISVKTLWEYYCTYSYLPRLSRFEVLQQAMEKGCAQGEYFAYAEGYSESEKRYIGLTWGTAVSVDRAGLLVKLSVAEHQEPSPAPGPGPNPQPGPEPVNPAPVTPPPSSSPQPRTFFMTADLDPVRINRDVSHILDEVTSHLTNAGMKLKFRLEVSGESSEGLDQQTVRTVVENCMALKITDVHFDE